MWWLKATQFKYKEQERVKPNPTPIKKNPQKSQKTHTDYSSFQEPIGELFPQLYTLCQIVDRTQYFQIFFLRWETCSSCHRLISYLRNSTFPLIQRNALFQCNTLTHLWYLFGHFPTLYFLSRASNIILYVGVTQTSQRISCGPFVPSCSLTIWFSFWPELMSQPSSDLWFQASNPIIPSVKCECRSLARKHPAASRQSPC